MARGKYHCVASLTPEFKSVEVKTNARLHMGFLDLNGELGRQFGSIGVNLDGLHTQLIVSDNGPDDLLVIEAQGQDAERAKNYAQQICKRFGISRKLNIEIRQSITPHAGLGSGTQLALAVGSAISKQFNLDLSAHDIASLLERGRRSSIGINTFKHGGFHIDCGTRAGLDAPPAFFSREFPSEWRLVLLFDHDHRGLHGETESNAFRDLSPLSSEDAGRLCRLAVMQLIPAVIEKDVLAFGDAITKIQAIVGDHFAPVQGGRFVSTSVREKLAWYDKHGAAGYGQSSWGPTGFVLCESEEDAIRLVEASADAMPDNPCQEMVIGASNKSAEIVTVRDV